MYLLKGFVDKMGFNAINSLAKKLESAGDAGEWKKVAKLTQEIEILVDNITNYMDWYNILKKVKPIVNNCNIDT